MPPDLRLETVRALTDPAEWAAGRYAVSGTGLTVEPHADTLRVRPAGAPFSHGQPCQTLTDLLRAAYQLGRDAGRADLAADLRRAIGAAPADRGD